MRFRNLVMFLMFALVVGAAAGYSEDKKAKTVVSGLVRVASSDSKGNVLSIEIMVGDTEEEPYLVANTPKGQELRKHVGEYVMAGGVVSEDALGWKTIEVLKYTFVDELKDKN